MVQFAPCASVTPHVVVERNGQPLAMRRMVSGEPGDVLVSVSRRRADCPDGTCPKGSTPPGMRFPATASVPAPIPYPSTYPMPLSVAEPSVGVPWAKSVPVMSPLTSGRNATEKLQLAYGARPEHGAPGRTNWRGNEIDRASDFAVRLSMVN